MKRSAKPIRKRTPRRISDRRRAELTAYRALRQVFLAQHPYCVVFPSLRATDVHHVRGRSGEALLDTRYWLPVSRQGHRWIHDHPAEAAQRGWLASKGQWLSTHDAPMNTTEPNPPDQAMSAEDIRQYFLDHGFSARAARVMANHYGNLKPPATRSDLDGVINHWQEFSSFEEAAEELGFDPRAELDPEEWGEPDFEDWLITEGYTVVSGRGAVCVLVGREDFA